MAHIKFTVLLMPNGSDRITSHPLQQLQPTKSIDEDPEIKAWLALGTKTKKKGGGKKKKGLFLFQCLMFILFMSSCFTLILTDTKNAKRSLAMHDSESLVWSSVFIVRVNRHERLEH